MSAAQVSVIVPVVAADDGFARCLASLARLDPPCADLVVALDGGDPEAAALASGAGAQVVRLTERRGPAAARNAGARVARGEVLFFIDADVTLPRDAIARVVAAFDARPGCDAVIGSYDDAPGASNFLSQYKNLAHHFIHQTSHEDACTFWGACGAIRREAFRRAGQFDEGYRRSSIEDVELGSRLAETGARIRLDRTLQVTHWKRWTPVALLRSEVRDRAVPWTRLILKTGRMPNDLNLRWSGRVAVASACLVPAAAALAVWYRPAWVAAVAAASLGAALDLPLARFLRAKRGTVFAARAIGWQFVHHLCCAAGFAAGTVLHLVDAGRSRVRFPVDQPLGRLSGDGEHE